MSDDPFTPPVSDTPVAPGTRSAMGNDGLLTYILKALIVIAIAIGLGWLIATLLGFNWGWIPIEC